MRHTGLAALPKLSLPALRPVLLRFSLAFLLAGTQLFGWLSPFGLAAVAAAGSGVSGLSALLGCFAGAFSFLPFAPALRYSAIALLIFSCAVVFSGTALQRKSFFAPATAGAMTLAVGFAYVGQAGWAFSVLLRTLLESLLAAGGCLLLQAKLPARSVSRRSGARENALPALRGCLEKAAAAFRSLYDSFGQPAPGPEENPAVIFDRAAEQTCRNCALRALCWEQEYQSTFNAMNDATPALLRRGRALAVDFPAYFSSRCLHFPDFLAAVNGELTALLLRRQYRQQLQQSQAEAGRQYACFSQLLSSAARHGEAAPRSKKAPLIYQVGSGSYPKRGESISGDSLTAFETPEGALCLLLSDGMGSGQEARRESAMVLRLLEQFLQAGIAAEPALQTLNAALSLHGDAGFTTVDLLQLQLWEGQALLYKYGAAPSYLRHKGQVRRVTGGSLPAGLSDDTIPEHTTLQLEPGSIFLMVSDGIADRQDDGWLMELLAGWEGDNAQALAHRILGESRRRQNAQDDGSLLVLTLPEKVPAAPLREV